MATENETEKDTQEQVEKAEAQVATSDEGSGDAAPVNLGVARYVHAAFFGAAILGAYVIGKIVTLLWNTLAEWPAAVRSVPALVAYDEEQREGFALMMGAAIGIVLVIHSYRKESIRGWADEVAGELAKVTWPGRDVVVNGTIVVIVAGAIATVYVAILDRFWGFLTTLVYGA